MRPRFRKPETARALQSCTRVILRAVVEIFQSPKEFAPSHEARSFTHQFHQSGHAGGEAEPKNNTGKVLKGQMSIANVRPGFDLAQVAAEADTPALDNVNPV